jgi:hypothetical protein
MFAFLEPNVDKGMAYSNLYEQYCEPLQLIFILPVISHE